MEESKMGSGEQPRDEESKNEEKTVWKETKDEERS